MATIRLGDRLRVPDPGEKVEFPITVELTLDRMRGLREGRMFLLDAVFTENSTPPDLALYEVTSKGFSPSFVLAGYGPRQRWESIPEGMSVPPNPWGVTFLEFKKEGRLSVAVMQLERDERGGSSVETCVFSWSTQGGDAELRWHPLRVERNGEVLFGYRKLGRRHPPDYTRKYPM